MNKDRLLLGAVIVILVIITYYHYHYQLSRYIYKFPIIKELQYQCQQVRELSLAEDSEEEELMVNACSETLPEGNNDSPRY